MNSIRTAATLVILAVIITGISMANKPNEGDGINITVSPSTLVLSRDICCVTVHSNISLILMTEDELDSLSASLRLSGPEDDPITPYLIKADDCGDLVAKFDGTDVKTIVGVEPGEVELTLRFTISGESFSASDTIRVK